MKARASLYRYEALSFLHPVYVWMSTAPLNTPIGYLPYTRVGFDAGDGLSRYRLKYELRYWQHPLVLGAEMCEGSWGQKYSINVILDVSVLLVRGAAFLAFMDISITSCKTSTLPRNAGDKAPSDVEPHCKRSAYIKNNYTLGWCPPFLTFPV